MEKVYFEVFKDSFFANFLPTLSQDFAIIFIQFFERYNQNIAGIAAILGSVLAIFLTFIFFYIAATMMKSTLDKGANYEVIQNALKRYGFLFFIISAFPNIMILAPIFAGLARYNIKSFIFYMILYRSLYYLYILYG